MGDDGREIAAGVLEGAAATAEMMAAAFGSNVAAGFLRAGAALARVAAKLVRTIGAENARKALEGLQARIEAGEGRITDADLASDDEAVSRYLDDLFGLR